MKSLDYKTPSPVVPRRNAMQLIVDLIVGSTQFVIGITVTGLIQAMRLGYIESVKRFDDLIAIGITRIRRGKLAAASQNAERRSVRLLQRRYG